MPDRRNSFSWSAVPFGVASLLMFGLSHHEGRRVRQFKQVHPVSSVSEALSLSKLLPTLIAVRGNTGSEKPLQTQITSNPAVMIEDSFGRKERTRSVAGEENWTNKIFRQYKKESDWFITDDGISRLTVESCANASHLEKTLVTSRRFALPHQGCWKQEKSLPVDTTVTIVGELANSAKEDGTMVIRKPSNDSKKAPFYITTQTYEELRTLFLRTARAARTFECLGVGLGAVTLILTGIKLWKNVRTRIRNRNNRKRIAEEKKWNERLKNEAELLLDTVQCETHLGKCKVCFDNTVDAVFMPCGHLYACMTCGKKLKACPICRSICTVHKVYIT